MTLACALQFHLIAAAQVLNSQISIVRLSQMFVDSDTIADIQLEGAMLFLVFVAACCVPRILQPRGCVLPR